MGLETSKMKEQSRYVYENKRTLEKSGTDENFKNISFAINLIACS
jgi:hypothetical protein